KTQGEVLFSAEGDDSGQGGKAAPKPGKAARRRFWDEAETVLKHLNQAAGRGFEAVEANLAPISARLAEVKGDVEGINRMIDRQAQLWRGDPVMGQYLRPATLFQRTKFRGYYDDRNQPTTTTARTTKTPDRRDLVCNPDDWNRRFQEHVAAHPDIPFD
ncbi:MAG: hypothetical protein EBS53_19375, partial [Bacteroidetes bacterium]|nr:hypothetical protein [Bacteroidota bacterium]